MMNCTSSSSYEPSGRRICPPAWHIAANEELKVLEGAADRHFDIGDPIWDENGSRGFDAGLNLKSTSGWNNQGNGNDLFGFGGQPGGYRNNNGSFYDSGHSGYWWSSAEYNTGTSWDRIIDYNSMQVGQSIYGKLLGFSVRCLKD
jgi:uncharacterized protein (TIGR02145 family)